MFSLFVISIFSIILQLINCDTNSSSIKNVDKESTNETIRSPFRSLLFSQRFNKILEETNDEIINLARDSMSIVSDVSMTTSVPIVPTDMISNNSLSDTSFNNPIIDSSLEQSNKANFTGVFVDDHSNSTVDTIRISNNSSDLNLIGIKTNETYKIQSDENQSKLMKTKVTGQSVFESIQNGSTIQMVITPTTNHTVNKSEMIKTNQTLLSTILLRMHSIVQYSTNISSQAVIPYVYLAKIQINGLYRQVVDSDFLQIYLSNLFNLILNDVMNKECNVLSAMANYVLIPAIEARGTSSYFMDRIREFKEDVSRWQNALQRWSSNLSTTFNHIAELKIEDCGQKLLCSLGKARYQTLKEDQPRQLKAKIIQFLNNLFNMPMLEKRLKRNFSEARQYGASGGDCESFNSNCAIPTDDLINLIK